VEGDYYKIIEDGVIVYGIGQKGQVMNRKLSQIVIKDYYKIIEDGAIVYGIGQKGQVMNRKLSQIVIKMKPDTKEFDIMQTELLAAFSFSYHQGPEDIDEVSSDQVLISKELFVDGNLMTEFGIISESNSKI